MPSLPPEGVGQRATVAPREEEGGVEQVAPGIWRITMPLPFALRWVNAYLLQGDGEYCLIDAGLATPDAEAFMLQGLVAAGISPPQLSTMVLTHAHPDHIGLAGRFQQASGAPVFMLRMERQRMQGIWAAEDSQAVESVSTYYIKYGMPPEESALEKGAMAATRRLVTVPQQVTSLEEGQQVRLAGELYEVIWTPGHADGHICLWRASDGVLIAGDHILPRISPNISLYPNSRPNPLQDYLDSLKKVRDLPARLVLPGHGFPLTGLAARADELAKHHQERIEETMQIVAEVQGASGASTYQVAEGLFAGRLDSLQNRRFAFAEALAHLEYLRFEGRLMYREEQGVVRYHVIR